MPVFSKILYARVSRSMRGISHSNRAIFGNDSSRWCWQRWTACYKRGRGELLDPRQRKAVNKGRMPGISDPGQPDTPEFCLELTRRWVPADLRHVLFSFLRQTRQRAQRLRQRWSVIGTGRNGQVFDLAIRQYSVFTVVPAANLH